MLFLEYPWLEVPMVPFLPTSPPGHGARWGSAHSKWVSRWEKGILQFGGNMDLALSFHDNNKREVFCVPADFFSLGPAVVCSSFYLISRSHLPNTFIFCAQIYKEVGNLWTTKKDT